jgi:non-ribosomal peptide synthetase component F
LARLGAVADDSQGAVEGLGFDASAVVAVRAFARRTGVTMYMIGLAGLMTVLRLYVARPRLAVRGYWANRTRPETRDLIGWMASGRLLGIELSRETTLREVLARVRQTVADASRHDELPAAAVWGSLIRDGVPLTNLFSDVELSFDFDVQRPAARLPDGLVLSPAPMTAPGQASSALRVVVA